MQITLHHVLWNGKSSGGVAAQFTDAVTLKGHPQLACPAASPPTCITTGKAGAALVHTLVHTSRRNDDAED